MSFIGKYKVSLFFCVIGIGCWLAYLSMGAYVDDSGRLVESFGFIPLCWLFELLAAVAFIFTFLRDKKRNKEKSSNG